MGLITEKTPLARIQPVKFLLNWGRRYSLWVFNFGLACCSIEFIAASTSKHDFIRFGVIPFAHGPRQADLIVIAGTPTDKMTPVIKRLYDQMPEVLPVDVYIPGCPPRPEALLQGIIRLQEKIAAEDIREKWSGKLTTPASAS